MVKTGGNINAIPMGKNTYQLMDGRIITHNELWKMELFFLKNKSSIEDASNLEKDKQKALKKVKKHCEKMLIVGYSEASVLNFFENEKQDIDRLYEQKDIDFFEQYQYNLF